MSLNKNQWSKTKLTWAAKEKVIALFLLYFNLKNCCLEILAIVVLPEIEASIEESRTRRIKVFGALHHYLSLWIKIYLKKKYSWNLHYVILIVFLFTINSLCWISWKSHGWCSNLLTTLWKWKIKLLKALHMEEKLQEGNLDLKRIRCHFEHFKCSKF